MSAWQGRGGVGELLLGMEGRLLDAQQGKTNKQKKKPKKTRNIFVSGKLETQNPPVLAFKPLRSQK